MRHADHHASDRPLLRGALLVALVAGAVAVAAALVLQPWSDGTSSEDLAGSAKVSASSTAAGWSSRDAVAPAPPDGDPGWRSAGETVGAWIELSWTSEHLLQEVTLTRPPSDPAITDGVLAFGDGSFLQVRLSGTPTRVPFSPRSTDRVRFTVSGVVPGVTAVGLARFAVDARTTGAGVGTDDAPGGDVAPRAAASTGTDAGGVGAGPGPDALLDGPQAPDGVGSDLVVARPEGTWVDLRWPTPRELTAIQVVGSARTAARLASATVVFSDGSRLPVGAVLPDPTRPTTVAFMPRVTTSLRLHLDRTAGPGPLGLAELRVFDRGTTPPRASSGPPAPALPSPVCAEGPDRPDPSSDGLVVLCPLSGATVDGRLDVVAALAPGYTEVEAEIWPGDPGRPPAATATATPDPGGIGRLALDLPPSESGAVTLVVTADGLLRPSRTARLTLLRPAPPTDPVPSSVPASGRTLVYAEEFRGPVSTTRTGLGADYAAGKPTDGGAEDFGDAAFADPASGFGTTEVVHGDHLRLAVRPTPPGAPVAAEHLGGLLASARTGGSGFSAQYGYFEARMFAPAGEGTWPAFWMLPSDNLVTPAPVVAEIDAVELYGHEPTGACQSTHEFRGGDDAGVARCGERFDSVREAFGWHTYGVAITPTGNTFYVDGRVVAVAPQVAGADSPMFFLLDLALGGGWPVDLGATRERADLLVDYVRVYV